MARVLKIVPETDLTPRQKITVAYAYYCLGQTQVQICAHYPGVNQGRINEACKEIGALLGLTEPGYKDRAQTNE